MNDRLFDAPRLPIGAFTGKAVARASDPQASHDAAARVNARLSKHRTDVLIVLDDLGVATAAQVRLEMQRRGLAPSESGPRSRLANLVKDYGYAALVRHTADRQAVYTTTDLGHTIAQDIRAAKRAAA